MYIMIPVYIQGGPKKNETNQNYTDTIYSYIMIPVYIVT